MNSSQRVHDVYKVMNVMCPQGYISENTVNPARTPIPTVSDLVYLGPIFGALCTKMVQERRHMINTNYIPSPLMQRVTKCHVQTAKVQDTFRKVLTFRLLDLIPSGAIFKYFPYFFRKYCFSFSKLTN